MLNKKLFASLTKVIIIAILLISIYSFVFVLAQEQATTITNSGNPILVTAEENKLINYKFDWGETNITLYKLINTYEVEVTKTYFDETSETNYTVIENETKYNYTIFNDIYINPKEKGWKFGANDSLKENEIASYKYIINSTSELVLLEKQAFDEKENFTFKYLILYNYYENPENEWNEFRHIYNFKDICSKKYSNCEWLKNENSIEIFFSSDGIIDPTIINVSSCQTLYIENQVYQLNQSINTTGDCIVVIGKNITFDLKGYNITRTDNVGEDYGIDALGGSSDYLIVKNGNIYNFERGINLGSSDYIEIKNITVNSNNYGIYLEPNTDFNKLKDIITNNNSRGIYLYSSSNNSLTNITANNNSYGIYLNSSSNNILIDITTNNNSYGIYLRSSPNNVLTNIITNNNSYGIYLLASSNNNITNTNISNSKTRDVYLISNSKNNIFLNTTYNKSKESVDANSELIRKWYYQAYINDTAGNNVSEVKVNVYNKTNDLILTLITDEDGLTPLSSLIDYTNKGGIRIYYSNYTINISHPCYESILSHNYNITEKTNIYEDVFTLTGFYPCVILNKPKNNTILNYTDVTFNCSALDDYGLKNISLYFESKREITLVQNKSDAHNYPSNNYGLTITLDSPATAGNLLVTGIAIDKNSGTITAPDGFTLVHKGEGVSTTASTSGAMAYKIAAGGETAITWNWTVSQEGTGWVGEYSGLATSNVFDVSAENESYLETVTNSLSTGANTTTQANELAIAMYMSDSGNSVGTPASWSWSNGFTTVAYYNKSSGSPYINVANKTLTSTGTVESTFSHGGNDESYAVIATFKAASVSWHANQTKEISGLRNETTFQVNLTDNSSYEWNCKVCDVDDNCNFSTSNFSFKINTSYNLPPQIILQYPSNGSTGIPRNVTLNVTLIDPEGTSMNVTFYGREKNNTNFTIIALPDTQKYSWRFPDIFTNQTEWIKSNKSELNILFVTHEGDIVENYDQPAYEDEWRRANESMSILDNQVPYGVLPGNHDMGSDAGGDKNQPGGTTNLYNKYFPVSRYEGVYDWYKGNFDRNDNNYQFFTTGGVDYIIVHIEYQANDTILDWANEILQTYSNKSAIITTHDYLEVEGDVGDNSRSPYGQHMWDYLIKSNPNVFLVLSGHRHVYTAQEGDDGEGRRNDTTNVAGKTVHQLVADYQDWFRNTDLWEQSGFLRIMKFVPADRKIEVKTYSPYLNQSQCTGDEYKWDNGCYKNDTEAEFTLDYAPFNYLGQDLNVVSGDNATYLWKDRKVSTTYEWFVEVVDSGGAKNTSDVWSFTTITGPPP